MKLAMVATAMGSSGGKLVPSLQQWSQNCSSEPCWLLAAITTLYEPLGLHPTHNPLIKHLWHWCTTTPNKPSTMGESLTSHALLTSSMSGVPRPPSRKQGPSSWLSSVCWAPSKSQQPSFPSTPSRSSKPMARRPWSYPSWGTKATSMAKATSFTSSNPVTSASALLQHGNTGNDPQLPFVARFTTHASSLNWNNQLAPSKCGHPQGSHLCGRP